MTKSCLAMFRKFAQVCGMAARRQRAVWKAKYIPCFYVPWISECSSAFWMGRFSSRCQTSRHYWVPLFVLITLPFFNCAATWISLLLKIQYHLKCWLSPAAGNHLVFLTSVFKNEWLFSTCVNYKELFLQRRPVCSCSCLMVFNQPWKGQEKYVVLYYKHLCTVRL